MDKRKFIIAVSIVGIILLIGFISVCSLDSIIYHEIARQSRLIPGTELYKQWLEPSVPIYLQFFIFNLTNPEQFKAGHKPKVQQLGPYTYRERRFKTSVSNDQIHGTVRFQEVKQYFFEPAKSNGLENDSITSVNLAFITVANKVSWLPLPIDRIIEIVELILKEDLIVQHTVQELLWGYEDNLLVFLKKLGIQISSTQLGLYAGKNNSADGVSLIEDGAKHPDLLGKMIEYHGRTSMTCWSTDTANMINGSDGSLFHPFLEWSEKPYLFSGDLCRSIQVHAVAKTSIHDVPVYKYLPMEDTFKSPLTCEKNRGFCPRGTQCLGDGVLDMSTCTPGAPIVISLPHLLYANQSYQDAVEGLHPTEEFNTTFFIEPQTGIVLQASKKLQINAVIKKNSKFRLLTNISDVFLPVAFINESVTIDSQTANLLKKSIIIGPMIAKFILSLIVIICAISICILVVVFVRYRRRTGYQVLQTANDPVI